MIATAGLHLNDSLFEDPLKFNPWRWKPEGAAVGNYVIQYALALFFEMPRHEAIKALEIYKRVGQQVPSYWASHLIELSFLMSLRRLQITSMHRILSGRVLVGRLDSPRKSSAAQDEEKLQSSPALELSNADKKSLLHSILDSNLN